MKKRCAKRFLISGRVQGVGFRYFAQRAATQAGVSGWARNLDDGRVEVHATGAVEQLNRFEGLLRVGPSRADIRGFEVLDAGPEDSSGFHIA